MISPLFSKSLQRFYRPLLRIAARMAVPRVVPRIVCRLSHDSSAFTQGILYHQGILYESTGQYGKSCLQSIDLNRERVLFRQPLPNDEWGEGIALLDDHIVQLTWKSQIAYVYSIPDLKVVDHIHFQGEGWGLSSWNNGYVMSDGSSLLTFRNKHFDVIRTLKAYSNMVPMSGLNDLQTVENMIYSNMFYRDEILEINSDSGMVLRFIDCKELVQLAAPQNRNHIINGIAYNEDEKLFYVTGKFWSGLFVIEIPKTT